MDYRNFKYSNLQENSKSEKSGGNTPDVRSSSSSVPPIGKAEEEKAVSSFDDYLNIGDVLMEQELKKRRFYKIVKSAVFAIFSILLFAGFFFFAKNHKSCKSVRS